MQVRSELGIRVVHHECRNRLATPAGAAWRLLVAIAARKQELLPRPSTREQLRLLAKKADSAPPYVITAARQTTDNAPGSAILGRDLSEPTFHISVHTRCGYD